jgi:co-chaperonin GroES (HSP10)
MMSKKLKPCGFFILIDMDEVETMSPGGIELPKSLVDTEQLGFDRGRPLAVGPTAYLAYKGAQDGKTPEERAAIWGYKLGDTVIFQKNAGKLMEHSAEAGREEDYRNKRFIVDSQIMAVEEAE